MQTEYNRGRNDRRDGKTKHDSPYQDATQAAFWLNGWMLQDSIIRNDMTYPAKLGKEAASKSHNSDTCPYLVGTKSYTAWQMAFMTVMAAKEAKAEKESA